jgi:hypothetical protein
MTHDEIIHAARERIAEIGNDRAHADEKGRLLDIVHGPRCDACGQHECATKEWARRGGGVFNGMPCMIVHERRMAPGPRRLAPPDARHPSHNGQHRPHLATPQRPQQQPRHDPQYHPP